MIAVLCLMSLLLGAEPGARADDPQPVPPPRNQLTPQQMQQLLQQQQQQIQQMQQQQQQHQQQAAPPPPPPSDSKAPPSFTGSEGMFRNVVPVGEGLFRNMVPVQEKEYPSRSTSSTESGKGKAQGEVHGLYISIQGPEKAEIMTVTEIPGKRTRKYEVRRQDLKKGKVKILGQLEYDGVIKQLTGDLSTLKDLAVSEPESCSDGQIEFKGGVESFKASFCVGTDVPGSQEAIARRIFTRFNYLLSH